MKLKSELTVLVQFLEDLWAIQNNTEQFSRWISLNLGEVLREFLKKRFYGMILGCYR